jgi:hypothetical protein
MGTNNSAANAATAANAQQQQNIQNAVGQINNAFNSPQRQAQYQQYGQNLQNYYTGQVNQQEAQNANQLTFANARSGLTGGSAAAYNNQQLQKDYTQALLQASQQAQGGQAALQQADINAKNQMISLAQQGNFTGSIPQEVSEAQNTTLQTAANYGNMNALGNLFGATKNIAQNEATAAANRAAQNSPIGSPYGSGYAQGSLYGAGGF